MTLDIDFSPLTDDELLTQPVAEPEEVKVPIVPVPEEALPLSYKHPYFGQPNEIWPYHTGDGELAGFVGVFVDNDGRVHRRPLTYCRSGQKTGWRAEGFPTPYPLFNLPELMTRPEAPVIIVNDERHADAAAKLFPTHVAVCSPYELGLFSDTDWSGLKGRHVIVCPCHGDVADDFARHAADCAYRAGAETVRVLMLKTVGQFVLGSNGMSKRPSTPEGWGLEQAVKEGWVAETFAEKIGPHAALPMVPKPLNIDPSGNSRFRRTENGIEALLPRGQKEEWKPICGPLELIAMSRTSDSDNWGRRFRLTNPDGQHVEVDLPTKEMAGDGATLRERLLSRGLTVRHGKPEREALLDFVMEAKTDARILDVPTVGWHNGVFVTSKDIIGSHPSGETVRYAGRLTSSLCATTGTYEGWRDGVAAMAVGNSRLLFAMSIAFAGPLLSLVDAESGAFHFVGSSSIGKTTALVVATSVWGGDGNSWRMTDNAAEAIASAHNHAVMCCDEIGQATSKVIDMIVYMLTNGSGKSRMVKDITNRPEFRWRLLVISTGEITVETKITEEASKKHAAAGQLVRFIDIEADAEVGYGMFQELHGFKSAAAFAEALKSTSRANSGHAAIAFIKHLQSNLEGHTQRVDQLMKAFLAELALPKGTDGQVHRVAQRFGLVAASGEVAIGGKIVPWPAGSAMAAAKTLFHEWLARRGTATAMEKKQAIERVRSFIQKYGVSFEDSNDNARPSAPRVKTGFITKIKGKTFYCFFPAAWRESVCSAMDEKRTARYLDEEGLLHRNLSGYSSSVKPEFGGNSQRVYAVSDDILYEPEPGIVDLKELYPDLQDKLYNENGYTVTQDTETGDTP
jgi:putative DNA primase/helicase